STPVDLAGVEDEAVVASGHPRLPATVVGDHAHEVSEGLILQRPNHPLYQMLGRVEGRQREGDLGHFSNGPVWLNMSRTHLPAWPFQDRSSKETTPPSGRGELCFINLASREGMGFCPAL